MFSRSERICPKCGRLLVKRGGKFGDFLGCSGWKKDNTGCNHKEKVI
ncbi:topoisomerase DNA-binding C4 zinc finger domain-containing protein [Allofrancisella inopinata]